MAMFAGIRAALRRAVILAVALFLPLLAGFAEPLAAGKGRSGPDLVVVEMFTSQSCSSCPPADAFLGDLARRQDVLALSMHVDYWNSLGWRDPFSSRDVTSRQRRYAGALGTGYVSTPQAIIQGRSYAVGSDRGAVLRQIEAVRRDGGPGIQPELEPSGRDRVTLRLPQQRLRAPATIWFVAFDDRHTAQIGAGENAGATVTYTNVVRDLRRIGTWTGEARSWEIDISNDRRSGFGNCAVLIQSRESGPLLGAVALPMAASGH
ncbi:MAG: DUF1223 domain-containing protein [Alphaproteobacteria bacterium]|nr:DUF1223 domain-containing protein [Alphaproteobacteria bacterium]